MTTTAAAAARRAAVVGSRRRRGGGRRAHRRRRAAVDRGQVGVRGRAYGAPAARVWYPPAWGECGWALEPRATARGRRGAAAAVDWLGADVERAAPMTCASSARRSPTPRRRPPSARSSSRPRAARPARARRRGAGGARRAPIPEDARVRVAALCASARRAGGASPLGWRLGEPPLALASGAPGAHELNVTLEYFYGGGGPAERAATARGGAFTVVGDAGQAARRRRRGRRRLADAAREPRARVVAGRRRRRRRRRRALHLALSRRRRRRGRRRALASARARREYKLIGGAGEGAGEGGRRRALDAAEPASTARSRSSAARKAPSCARRSRGRASATSRARCARSPTAARSRTRHVVRGGLGMGVRAAAAAGAAHDDDNHAPATIPRVIHRIWLGDEPMPPEYAAFGERWTSSCPAGRRGCGATPSRAGVADARRPRPRPRPAATTAARRRSSARRPCSRRCTTRARADVLRLLVLFRAACTPTSTWSRCARSTRCSSTGAPPAARRAGRRVRGARGREHREQRARRRGVLRARLRAVRARKRAALGPHRHARGRAPPRARAVGPSFFSRAVDAWNAAAAPAARPRA